MTQQEKISAMVEALWPLIKQRIEEEFTIARRSRQRTYIKRPMVYIPEIDWMIATYRVRGEVRLARYNENGRLATQQGTAKAESRYYCLGASGTLPTGEYTNDVYIPTKTLVQLEPLHGVTVKTDFRVGSAATFYAGGVTGPSGDVMKGSCSCYPVRLALPITKEIIKNTREEWEQYTEDQLAMRLVRRTHMMELLDILEQGQITPEQQINMWRLVAVKAGYEFTFDEAEALQGNDPRRLSAKWIAPSWMGDDIA
jgi:hypothetical protein